MGIFGTVTAADNARIAGVPVLVMPGYYVLSSSRSDERNFEIGLSTPGTYQIALFDLALLREMSPRVTVTINPVNQCDISLGEPGAQWVEINFRHY